LFRVRGIQLAVHGSFFLLLAWIAYEGWQLGGWPTLFWCVGILLAFFVCVVLHELGHSFTAMAFGIGVSRILLMPIGGMAQFDDIPREPRRELLITLAGPAVNFLIAGLLWPIVGLAADDGIPITTRGFFQLLLHANLAMGCFNLLPVFPMDGGRILRAFLAWRMPYVRATYWASRVARVLAVVAIGTILFSPFFGRWQERILPSVLFVFIGIVGELEYRATLRREREDEHWRASLARLYGPAPTAEPPPVSP